jgi:ribosomal protein S10
MPVTFDDPSGPVPVPRQNEAMKVLKKAVGDKNLKKYPYCHIRYVASPATAYGVSTNHDS